MMKCSISQLWWQVYGCTHLSKHIELYLKWTFFACELHSNKVTLLKTYNILLLLLPNKSKLIKEVKGLAQRTHIKL